jgi:hypothetical protein
MIGTSGEYLQLLSSFTINDFKYSLHCSGQYQLSEENEIVSPALYVLHISRLITKGNTSMYPSPTLGARISSKARSLRIV